MPSISRPDRARSAAMEIRLWASNIGSSKKPMRHPRSASYRSSIYLSTGNANRGLGNGGNQVFIALAMQKTNGKFQMNGNGGYWINNGPYNRSYWFLGWQAQYPFTSHWQLGIE